MFDQSQVLVAAAIVFLGLSTPETKPNHPSNASRSSKHTTEVYCNKNACHCTPSDHKQNVTRFLVSDAYCWSAL
ncbi:hypothetical protein K492DRAFT_207012 [Lichtheimia hyalospora FSU 10163]|nr:hypothetical protein K492DRAFT_207012 [Lichtheimia hyalospora FSU 10163]